MSNELQKKILAIVLPHASSIPRRMDVCVSYTICYSPTGISVFNTVSKIMFGVVGYDYEKDFLWGRGSVLQKYSDSSKSALHTAYTQAMRSAVENTNLTELDRITTDISNVGSQYGVSFMGRLHNKLIMQNGSYSTAVGVFDRDVPFAQRGLGSKRLLSMGLNIHASSNGSLILVDELETGLEPYRISTLINQLRAEFSDKGQIIFTTHCVLDQHKIFAEINKTVPVIVLGDPLQAIFGWAGKLVSWKDLPFEIVEIDTYPWRWHETNPALGQYLNNIRPVLMPGLDGKRVQIDIEPVKDCVRVVPSSCKYDLSILNYIRDYKSVLFIAKWPTEQRAFCQLTGGIFQNDEPQGLNYLYEVAEKFDEQNGMISAKTIMDFLENSTTKVSQELGSYKKHIANGDGDFSGLRKHKDFGQLLSAVIEDPSIENILNTLEWVKNKGDFKFYRKELFYELSLFPG